MPRFFCFEGSAPWAVFYERGCQEKTSPYPAARVFFRQPASTTPAVAIKPRSAPSDDRRPAIRPELALTSEAVWGDDRRDHLRGADGAERRYLQQHLARGVAAALGDRSFARLPPQAGRGDPTPSRMKLKWTQFTKPEFVERMYLLDCCGRVSGVRSKSHDQRQGCGARRRAHGCLWRASAPTYWQQMTRQVRLTTRFVPEHLPPPRLRVFK